MEAEKLKKALLDISNILKSTPAYRQDYLSSIEYLRREAQRLENVIAEINDICEAAVVSIE